MFIKKIFFVLNFCLAILALACAMQVSLTGGAGADFYFPAFVALLLLIVGAALIGSWQAFLLTLGLALTALSLGSLWDGIDATGQAWGDQVPSVWLLNQAWENFPPVGPALWFLEVGLVTLLIALLVFPHKKNKKKKREAES